MKPAWAQLVSAAKAGALKPNWNRHPQHVEIGEVHDLAVEIGAPVAVDHDRQEQARDQEEIRHPERLRKRDQKMHEAGLAAANSTPSTECIITTMTMQMPLA